MTNHATFGLLLLPPPPQPLSPAILNAAYRPPLKAALQKFRRVAARSSTHASFDIALPYPGYTSGQNQRTLSGCEETLLHSIQDLLLNTYTLIYSLCDEQKQQKAGFIDTPSPGTPNTNNLDIRIILLGYDQGFNYDTLVRPARAIPSCIVDLSILALCDRNWSRLYVTEGEPGERLYRQFTALVNGSLSTRVGGTWEMERVPGGISFNMRQQSQTLPSAIFPAPDANAMAARVAARRVLVFGSEEKKKKGSNSLLADLNQKLQLTVGLLLSEFNGTSSQETPDLADDSHPSLPLSNPATLELVRFLQSIVDWRIAGDRFSKAQPTSSRLRFNNNMDGSILINPWKLYIAESPQQLKRIIGSNDEEDGAHLEYTIVVGESLKHSLVNLIEPWNDKCRMVVCQNLAASSFRSDELLGDPLCQN
ncbi:hypothetical protein AJ78_01135 [Emergomyces pasteurianus Ep9510]|uniref:Uncharacterized protein n=1 Tax=Emergomyces pasteurianus Ep9510 TaxID=1447872 RepID=A0A1J9PR02_9EURO|nr:hypothetical protein AJ78_01135 [Emergomyces pasteurianus Ep9510]